MKSFFKKSISPPIVLLFASVTVRADGSSESICTDGFSVESLVPLFLYGGYHFAVGYRRENF